MPVMKTDENTELLYIDFSKDGFELGGSSFAQSIGAIGQAVPDVKSANYFKKCFNAIQKLIESNLVLAGHDVSAGGLITTLLEMNFANTTYGMNLDLGAFDVLDERGLRGINVRRWKRAKKQQWR